MKDQGVSVIIPSLADASRAYLIHRAIESVLAQHDVRALPVVVVNGGRQDSAVLESIKSRRDIRCIHFSYGGLPEARLRGRDSVETPLFAYLDDDDELLPESLKMRLAPMFSDDSIDVVVSNGLRVSSAGVVSITDKDIDRFQSDPLRGLLQTNWLNESGGLFRTDRIGREFFVNLPPLVEWTYIAFLLSQSRKIRFLNAQTFKKHDTPLSLSKSKQFLLEEPVVLRRILNLPMPDDVRAGFRRKYANALHKVSMRYLEDDDFRAAWKYHMRSSLNPGGWRYLSYTRHIVRRQLANAGKPRLGG